MLASNLDFTISKHWTTFNVPYSTALTIIIIIIITTKILLSMIQKLTLKLYPANTSHNIDAHITLFVLQVVIQNRKMNKKDFHQRLPGQLQGLYTHKDKT